MTVNNAQQNNYLTMKQNRKPPNFKNLKPLLGGRNQGYNTYIFENPIFERHISQYMEET